MKFNLSIEVMFQDLQLRIKRLKFIIDIVGTFDDKGLEMTRGLMARRLARPRALPSYVLIRKTNLSQKFKLIGDRLTRQTKCPICILTNSN